MIDYEEIRAAKRSRIKFKECIIESTIKAFEAEN